MASPEHAVPPEELREALEAAAARVADYLAGIAERPIFPADPQAPAGPLVTEEGRPLSELVGEVADWAEAHAVHVGHPGYAGHMDSGVEPAGIVADLLASALNQNLLAFELAPGATLLEKRLLRLFADRAGFGPEAGGVFTTGGTGANLTALLLARDRAEPDASRRGLRGNWAVLASADAHYSIAKSCAVLGLGSEACEPVAVRGPERRMDPDDLAAAGDRARARGREVLAVVATAGTTAVGAVDPIAACADFCASEGLWLHVDGAHGGALLFHDEGRSRLLAGLERADSLGMDPHKWLWAPKSAGLLLVRDERLLKVADYEAPYLDRLLPHDEAVPLSQGRRALDGSRRFDALKVWMVLRRLGLRGLRERLEDRLRTARALHAALEDHPVFEPRHRPDLNVVAFGPRDPAADADVAAVHRALEAEGEAWTSLTRLDGRPCHRMVLINPGMGPERALEVVGRLAALHQQAAAARSQGGGGLLHSSPPRPLASGWRSSPPPGSPAQSPPR